MSFFQFAPTSPAPVYDVNTHTYDTYTATAVAPAMPSEAQIIAVDPRTGYACFPEPNGDPRNHLLPVFRMDEQPPQLDTDSEKESEKTHEDERMYWMPDKLCKVCYTCEQPFTMFRRRHHCRLCGQVFCNSCSNYFVDGLAVGFQGVARSCRLCHEQLSKGQTLFVSRGSRHDEQFESLGQHSTAESMEANGPQLNSDILLPYKSGPQGDPSIAHALIRDGNFLSEGGEEALEKSSSIGIDEPRKGHVLHASMDFSSVVSNAPLKEHQNENAGHVRVLESRASNHLENIVARLVNAADTIEEHSRERWRRIIVDLVREVVGTVDPDVKNGDNIDIRPYVKMKSIPGGSIDGNRYIDGVVFHKNVAHKKMKHLILQPKILLLAGGIEFQRTDSWLSSLETLLEQEDRYMQILVEKIMTLKPDILLVGKAVSRKAQELLFQQNVVVMQHIKKHLLQRIARMTGGRILPSTDHMIHQHGEKALGRCRRFYVKSIPIEGAGAGARNADRLEQQLSDNVVSADDDALLPRSKSRIHQKPKTNTFAYLEGCPPELGCTLVLRGASRDVLKEVKTIIRFSVMVAYHLRLEVSYINDRHGLLPETQSIEVFDYEDGELSATESELDDTSDKDDDKSDTHLSSSAQSRTTSPAKSIRSSSAKYMTQRQRQYSKSKASYPKFSPVLTNIQWRLCLSSSLDVDIGTPYKNELRGLRIGKRTTTTMDSPYDHQSMLVTTVLMTNLRTQRLPGAEVQGIRFYTGQDMALGSFLVDSWFQLTAKTTPGVPTRKTMLDHTLSFVHRTGRLDISLHIIDENRLAQPPMERSTSFQNPYHTPIRMWSFCKACDKVATPVVAMSEETWKMSFGKFLEISFYNRKLRCRTAGCNHIVRDNHVLWFGVDDLAARFEFVPIHPYSVHIRKVLPFDDTFHAVQTTKFLNQTSQVANQIFEEFRSKVTQLEREAKELLGRKPEALQIVVSELQILGQEIWHSSKRLADQLAAAIDRLPATSKDIRSLCDSPKDPAVDKSEKEQYQPHDGDVAAELVDEFENNLLRNPMSLRKALYVKSTGWNERLDTLGRYIDSVHQADGLIPNLSLHPFLHPQKPAVPAQIALELYESEDDEHHHHHRNSEFRKLTSATFLSPSKPVENEGQLPHAQILSTSLHPASAVVDADEEFSVTPLMSPTPIQPRLSTLVQDAHTSGDGDGDRGTGEQIYGTGDTHDPSPERQAVKLSEQMLSGVESLDRLSSDPSDTKPITEEFGSGPSTPSLHPLTSDHPHSSHTHTYMHSQSNSQQESGTDGSASADVNHKNAQSKKHKEKGFTSTLRAYIMGRENVEDSEYKVCLGELGEGRPGLPVGWNNMVVLVHEDQPTSLIAYSLASEEYLARYQELLRADEISSVAFAEGEVLADKNSIYNARESFGPSLHNSAIDIATQNDGFGDEAPPFPHASARSASLVLHSPSPEPGHVHKPQIHAFSAASTPTSIHIEHQKEQDFLEESLLDAALPYDDTHEDVHTHPHGMTGIRTAMFGGSQPIVDELHDSATQEVEAGQEPRTVSEMARTSLILHDKGLLERQMLSAGKTHIKHRFVDLDEKGNTTCKFICHTYYATQFAALRQAFFKDDDDDGYIRSLSMSAKWNAQGGKSGATFSKTLDGRFVVKQITRTELQMFLEFAPAYFEYMTKALFHNLPTVLCKIVGVYQIGFHNRVSGKKVMEQVVVMENLFHNRSVTRTFDLKGSSRARYVEMLDKMSSGHDFDSQPIKPDDILPNPNPKPTPIPPNPQVLLDDNLMELTKGRPFPLKHRAKVFTYKAVLNDTTFLSIINIVDYSILVGFDENNHELVMGIIDYMRQYDIIKKMERMGKSVGMIAGQAEPTVIQPLQYRKRFRAAMERYLMTVPDKWTMFS